MIGKFWRQPKPGRWVAYQSVGAVVVFFVPLLTRFGTDALVIARSHWYASAGVAVAYFLVASWVAWRLIMARDVGLGDLVSASGVAFGTLLLFLLVWSGEFSRVTLLSGLAIAVLALVAPFARPWPLRGLLFAGIAAIAAAPIAARQLGVTADPPIPSDLIYTTFYALDVRTFREDTVRSFSSGGAIERLDDDYLLVNGDGRFFVLSFPRPYALEVTPLAMRTPMNFDAFSADVAPDVNRRTFRTADLLVQQTGDEVKLLASHHHWRSDEQCFVVMLSELTTTREALLAAKDTDSWRTVFESRPCLPIRRPEQRPWTNDKIPFTGEQIGGRLLDLGDGRVLLALGDHQFDGWNANEAYPQDPTADHGKVIEIETASGSARHLTVGHRNPQGLAFDDQGRIWLTEHGPRGGDELNLIVDGANYGWPFATYGTEYGRYEWPMLQEPPVPTAFEAPVFSWVPSIAVSNLFVVRDTMFPLWRGDLLLGTLGNESLWRLRLVDDRVVYTETIPLRTRIRDLIEGDGQIVMWADSIILSLTRAPLEGRGDVAFGQCLGCHQTGDGANQALGPSLSGILGREIASAPGFNYSEAMRGLDGTWTAERLDRFLADPSAEVPGTSMAFPGIDEPAQRAALIEYLSRLR